MQKLSSTNLSMSDVADVLGMSTPYNLSDFVDYGNSINICSVWKPITSSASTVTPEILHEYDYGLKSAETLPFWSNNKEALLSALFGATSNAPTISEIGDWYYDLPYDDNHYRLGDFRNYVDASDLDDYYYCVSGFNPTFQIEVESPPTAIVPPDTTIGVGIGYVRDFSDISSISNPEDYIVSPKNLLSKNLKLCLLMTENDTGEIYSAVSTNYVIYESGTTYWFTSNVSERVSIDITSEANTTLACGLFLIDDDGYMCIVPRSGFYIEVQGETANHEGDDDGNDPDDGSTTGNTENDAEEDGGGGEDSGENPEEEEPTVIDPSGEEGDSPESSDDNVETT